MFQNNEVKGLVSKFFSVKYSTRCPIYFFNNAKNQPEFEDLEKLKHVVKQGDVLLRKHKGYLDGIVLGQTSYFTHAGIYYGDLKNKEGQIENYQVLHAIGDKGVTPISLDEFCKCDHIAVVRFTSTPQLIEQRKKNNALLNFLHDKKKKMQDLTKIKLENYKVDNAWSNSAFPSDVLTFIKKKKDDLSKEEPRSTGEDERTIYINLRDSIASKDVVYEPNPASYIPLIKEQASNLIGTPYDYNFNFVNFETLSCVEYVWFCYKCLFPLHLIKRKEFVYFGWVRAFVLVPDMFVVNSFFNIEYTNVPGLKEVNDLKRYVRSHFANFWIFLLKVIFWETLVFLGIFLIISAVRFAMS